MGQGWNIRSIYSLNYCAAQTTFLWSIFNYVQNEYEFKSSEVKGTISEDISIHKLLKDFEADAGERRNWPESKKSSELVVTYCSPLSLHPHLIVALKISYRML